MRTKVEPSPNRLVTDRSPPISTRGHYFYADYCAGWVRSFRYANGTVSSRRKWNIGNVGNVMSFGEDAAGEMYLLSTNGFVYRFAN